MSLDPQEALRLLRRLRQVREYTAEPVSDAVLNDILEVGRWTGTGANRQPLDVVVVRDKALLSKFEGWGAKPASAAPCALLIVNSGQSPLDEGRMGERLMLAAAAHGLGAGLATLKNEGPDEAKKALGIPEDRRVVVVISIGHTDVEKRAALPKSTTPLRRPLSEFAHLDRW